KRAIAPTVSFHEFVGGHPLRTEHHVGGVVEIPVLVEKSALRLHLPEEWCARIGRQDVKGGALKTVLLNPGYRFLEHLRVVIVEAQHETAVYLDTIVVKDRYSPGVISRARRPLARCFQIPVRQRFKADENAGATRQGHLSDQREIVRREIAE